MPRTAQKTAFLAKRGKTTISAIVAIALTVTAGSAFAGSSVAGDLPVLSQTHVSDAAKRGFNPQPEPPKLRGTNAGAVMLTKVIC